MRKTVSEAPAGKPIGNIKPREGMRVLLWLRDEGADDWLIGEWVGNGWQLIPEREAVDPADVETYHPMPPRRLRGAA